MCTKRSTQALLPSLWSSQRYKNLPCYDLRYFRYLAPIVRLIRKSVARRPKIKRFTSTIIASPPVIVLKNVVGLVVAVPPYSVTQLVVLESTTVHVVVESIILKSAFFRSQQADFNKLKQICQRTKGIHLCLYALVPQFPRCGTSRNHSISRDQFHQLSNDVEGERNTYR